MKPNVRTVGVVVPAHDEAGTIGDCLDSVASAARHPLLRGVAVEVVAVLDRCTDDTAREVARPRTVEITSIAVDHRSAGHARRAGLAHLLCSHRDRLDGLWLATTDADTVVPADWLTRQLAWRGRGADAIAGTVRVEGWAAHPPSVRRRFEQHQARLGTGDGHQHVHGANLSFSAAAYIAAGGMPEIALAEDHALWTALRATGHAVVAAGDLAVTTSARRDARATGGFGSFLRSLATDGGAPMPLHPGSQRSCG